ncbi:MAG: YraN family protein [Luteolibacter sp.]
MTARDGTPLDRKAIGDFGEKVAAAWLRAEGFKVLFRNYRAPRGGEVDIVARQGELLLFVEVKTRRSGAKIRGYDAVNADKQALIERGARHWLKLLKRTDIPWRFDVIEVTVEDGRKPTVHRIENAF